MLMTARTSKLRAVKPVVIPATIQFVGSGQGTGGPGGPGNDYISVGIGTAAADRYLVMVSVYDTGGAGAIALSTIYINNTPGLTTKLAGFNQSEFTIEIWITNSPFTSGTSAQFTPVPASGSWIDMGLSVYSVRGLISNTISGSAQSTTTSGTSMGLPILADGVAIGGCCLIDAAKPGTSDGSAFVWTGLTEDRDKKSNLTHYGSASLASATATTLSISSTKTGGTTFGVLCCALR